MNSKYWLYDGEYDCISGPYTLKEAWSKREELQEYDIKVLILKTIVDYDGKEVK